MNANLRARGLLLCGLCLLVGCGGDGAEQALIGKKLSSGQTIGRAACLSHQGSKGAYDCIVAPAKGPSFQASRCGFILRSGKATRLTCK